MTTFREAEDVYLYGGGIQMEEEQLCARCGDDLDSESIEVDGEHYCSRCHRMIVRAYERDIRYKLKDYLKESDAFKCMCIKEALESYAEEFDN